jgi:hypothetical protein
MLSTWMEAAVDEGMSGEGVLRLFGRFEPLHLPLSSPRRPLRVLGPIVQISASSVVDVGKQLAPSDAIASQLVGHDHPRDVSQTLQKPPEEALRGVGIAPDLNENVEHNAILIDGAPEVMLDALDPDEDLASRPGESHPRALLERYC